MSDRPHLLNDILGEDAKRIVEEQSADEAQGISWTLDAYTDVWHPVTSQV